LLDHLAAGGIDVKHGNHFRGAGRATGGRRAGRGEG
jgi:hypothetical protein